MGVALAISIIKLLTGHLFRVILSPASRMHHIEIYNQGLMMRKFFINSDFIIRTYVRTTSRQILLRVIGIFLRAKTALVLSPAAVHVRKTNLEV